MYLNFFNVLFIFILFSPILVSSINSTESNDAETWDVEVTSDSDCSNQLSSFNHCSEDNRCTSNGIQLPNGNITFSIIDNMKTLHFSCEPGHHLIGPPKVICQEWDDLLDKPSCIKGCLKPPFVLNGEVFIIGEDLQVFSDGVVAEYKCAPRYKLVPILSQHRVCRNGEWTGEPVSCVFDETCRRLRGILHGRILEDSIDEILSKDVMGDNLNNEDFVKKDVIVRFKCDTGYSLIGPTFVKCLSSGQWEPHKIPICRKLKHNFNKTMSASSMEFNSPIKTSTNLDYYQPNRDSSVSILDNFCYYPPLGSHVEILAIQTSSGESYVESTDVFPDGTIIETTCSFGYRDKRSPCVRQILHCVRSSWQGHLPSCVKADNCLFPTKISHGELESISGNIGGGLFTAGGQVTYSCLPGYQLTGEALLTCQTGGCWEPNIIPMCEPQFYLNAGLPDYWNANTSLLFSVVTALSVLFVLLSVCVAVVCRHRPPMHHHHSTVSQNPPTLVPPPPPDPDRVALIAFADGVQTGLPTYEEAVRGSNGSGRSSFSYRLHHPPWSQRRNPRPDVTVVARQLSSTGESMGSTDTMTVSDVSTNVTLDTVSSHTCSSTSQTASCRAICGSLASFDTSSVLNTEGVPLLEENELEENGLNSDLDDCSVLPACDNTSFKLQSDIDSIHS